MSGRIAVHLDVMLARRKTTSRALAERVGVTEQALSMMRTGKIRGVRFSTLIAICDALDCQPGDILEFVREPAQGESPAP